MNDQPNHMKKCTLTLYQVQWGANTEDYSLEHLTEQAWRKLEGSQNRIIELNDIDRVIGSSAMHNNGKGFFIHCEKYGDNQPTSMVDMKNQEEIHPQLMFPGNSENFQKDEFFGLLFKNYAITHSTHKNGAALSTYLRGLFDLADFKKDAQLFRLSHIPNLEALKIINEKGVKSIELPFKLSNTDQKYINRDDRSYNSGIAYAIGKYFNEAFKQTGSFAKSGGTGRLTLVSQKSDPPDVTNRMHEMTKKILEDDENNEFTIELHGTKNKITQNELRIQKEVEVPRHGRGVVRDQIWLRMNDYLEELKEGNFVD